MCDLETSGGQKAYCKHLKFNCDVRNKNHETSSRSTDRGSIDLWRCLLSSGPAHFVNINYYCGCFFFLVYLAKNSQFHFMLTDDFKFHTLGL